MNESPDHTHTDSFAGWMNRHDAVEMDALAILISHHLELGMLQHESLSTKSWPTVDNEPRAGCDGFLHMKEIKPPKGKP